MNTEPLQQEGYDFMATAFEVYNEMGHGFTLKTSTRKALESNSLNTTFPSSVSTQTANFLQRAASAEAIPSPISLCLNISSSSSKLVGNIAHLQSMRHNCSIISKLPVILSVISSILGPVPRKTRLASPFALIAHPKPTVPISVHQWLKKNVSSPPMETPRTLIFISVD